jgi:hypothetical protein
VTPAETLRALCALRLDLPPGATVHLSLDWLSEAVSGTADAPVPSVTALPPVDLTCAEVGQRLGRAASTIRSYCEVGTLVGAYRWKGRQWRIPPACLARFEEEMRESGRRGAGAKPGPARSRGRPVDLGAWRRSAS